MRCHASRSEALAQFELRSIRPKAVSANPKSTALGKPGDDLLSRALRHSTIGAGAFHGRVRDGIGCGRSASITRPTKGGDKSGPNMPGLHALDAQRAQATRSAVAQ